MLEVFLIAVIVVLIVDISGFIDSLKSGLRYISTKGKMSSPDYSLKPLDCSLCCTFWTGLIYVIAIGEFSIWMLVWILLMSTFTPVIKDMILFIRDLMIKIISRLYEGIQ